ncbi:MAG: DUF4390 domain-containing protein [Chromatiales bacterium]|nr:DUF4390 domain-containing protein [Chromatiales bacterium]
MSVHLTNGVYQLNADIKFELSEATIEAVEHGVALTVVVETDVVQTRRYMWNEVIADIEASYSIEYHALSDQYVVRNLELDLSRSYRRLSALLDDLGRLRNFPLIGVRRLAMDRTYAVRVRARLDIESLPAPMRPLAYLNSLWRLDSDWHERPIPR